MSKRPRFDRNWRHAQDVLGKHTVYDPSCWDYQNRYLVVQGRVSVKKVDSRAQAMEAVQKGMSVYDLKHGIKILFDTRS